MREKAGEHRDPDVMRGLARDHNAQHRPAQSWLAAP
jgi:hypothetical protein